MLLARRVEAHEQGRSGHTVPSTHALWFFGRRLLLWTDPAQLAFRLPDRVHDGQGAVSLSDRFVDSGDWSAVIQPVERLAEHRDMIDLVAFGRDYPDMPAFKEMLRRIAKNRPAMRYGSSMDSEEKLHDYFRYFASLVESIRTHGFRPQVGVPREGVSAGKEVRGNSALHQRDIGAAIAADGRVLRFLGGRHRTAIAQALNIPAVPVEIRLVHAEWLAAEVRRTGLEPVDALERWVGSVGLPAPTCREGPAGS